MKQKIYLMIAVVMTALFICADVKAQQDCVTGTGAEFGAFGITQGNFIGQSFKPDCNGKLKNFLFRRQTFFVPVLNFEGYLEIREGDGLNGNIISSQNFSANPDGNGWFDIQLQIQPNVDKTKSYTVLVSPTNTGFDNINFIKNNGAYPDGQMYWFGQAWPGQDLVFFAFTTPCTTAPSTTDITICPSELPFIWNGLNITGAGSQTAHITNAEGCDSAATLNVTLKSSPAPLSLSATPSSICLGQSSVLSAVPSGFKGDFSPYKWEYSGNAILDTMSAPNFITITTPEYGVGSVVGNTDYVYKNLPSSGQLTFRWYKITGDPSRTSFYYLHNGIWNLIPNSDNANYNGDNITINVTKGEDFGFRVFKKFNTPVYTIGFFSILSSPTPTSPISWFTTPTGGSAFSTNLSTTVTPTVGGTVNYYAQTTDAVSGCASSPRDVIAVEVKTPVGITSITAANNPICGGAKTTLTANGVTGTNALVTWYDGPPSVVASGNVIGTGLTSPLVGVGTYYAVVTGDCGTPAQLSITLTGDATNPLITCPANVIVSNTNTLNCTKAVVLSAPTYSDNCAVKALNWVLSGATNATSSLTGIKPITSRTFNNGTTTITYTVLDYSNLSATCSFNVTVNDIVKPSFTTAPANINVTTAGCSASINVADVSFTDNCGAPTLSWVATGATTVSGNTQVGTMNFNLGTTTLTYTLTDANANVRTASITVKVTETIPPVMTCPSNITTSTVGTSCTKNIATPDPIYLLSKCGAKSLTWSMTGATVLSSPINGTWLAKTKTFKSGLTTVKYTATYFSGSTSTCTYTVQLNTNNVCPGATQSRGIVANEQVATDLKAILSPNPTSSTFALRVKSNNNAAVEVTVYNSEGKRIEQMKTAHLNNILFGEKYTAGSYMIEVRQGEKRTKVVGVKQ